MTQISVFEQQSSAESKSQMRGRKAFKKKVAVQADLLDHTNGSGAFDRSWLELNLIKLPHSFTHSPTDFPHGLVCHYCRGFYICRESREIQLPAETCGGICFAEPPNRRRRSVYRKSDTRWQSEHVLSISVKYGQLMKLCT